MKDGTSCAIFRRFFRCSQISRSTFKSDSLHKSRSDPPSPTFERRRRRWWMLRILHFSFSASNIIAELRRFLAYSIAGDEGGTRLNNILALTSRYVDGYSLYLKFDLINNFFHFISFIHSKLPIGAYWFYFFMIPNRSHFKFWIVVQIWPCLELNYSGSFGCSSKKVVSVEVVWSGVEIW